MPLNQLIAQGGTQIKSPVQRYMATRKQMGDEERNRLSQQSTMQNMNIQRQQLAMQKQEQRAQMTQSYGEAITPLMEAVDQQENKQAAWTKMQPEVDKIRRQFQIPYDQAIDTWNQQAVDSLISRYGDKKGNFVNAMTPDNKVVAGRTRGGIMYDPQGNKQPTWIKAPTKSENVEREGWGTDSQLGKLEIEHTRAEEDVYKLVNNLDTLKDFISSEEYVGGTTGDILSAGNSLVQQLKQLTGYGEIDVRKLGKSIDDSGKGEYSRLRKAAMKGDQKAALVIELSYNIAKSFDRGGRVTDADFKFARRLIDGSADVDSSLQTIDDFRDRSIKNYNASDAIFSSKWERDERQFSDDFYRKAYERKSPEKGLPDEGEDFKSSVFKEFGV